MREEKPFLAISYSAHLPASTVTFLVPQGIPLPIGTYEIRPLGVTTDEHRAMFKREIAMNDADYARREAAGEFD